MSADVALEGNKGTIRKVWCFIKHHGLPDEDESLKQIPTEAKAKRLKIRFRDIKLKIAV